jgi:hypothetical protein
MEAASIKSGETPSSLDMSALSAALDATRENTEKMEKDDTGDKMTEITVSVE